jgi:hypothetical protein
LEAFVEYFLWESSTECMVSVGMPTDADVKCWIGWLMLREDGASPEVQSIVQTCREYLKT